MPMSYPLVNSGPLRETKNFGRNLHGLGQTQARSNLSVIQEYNRSARGLAGVEDWFRGVRPSNWRVLVDSILRLAGAERKNVRENILGKLGNEDAESRLFDGWNTVWLRAYNIQRDPPSWLATAADKVGVFLSDFHAGATDVWREYSTWAVSASGPILKTYWESAKRIEELKANLASATASGEVVPSILQAQRDKIAGAENALNVVRQTFRAASAGGDIDGIAQSEHGKYMGAGIVGTIAVAIVIVAVAAAIYAVAELVKAIDALIFGVGPGKPPYAGLAIAGLAVIGGVTLYLVLK